MKTKLILLSIVAALGVYSVTTAQRPEPETNPATKVDVPLKHARHTVKMLDDLYKNAVVLITKVYVEDESSTPAVTAAQALWATMHEAGWHNARLVDATGDPYDADNVPKSELEKKMIGKLNTKDNYFDSVVEKDGKRYLHAVTQVPVVMKKCTLCHENYKDVAPGATIGAISYQIPILD